MASKLTALTAGRRSDILVRQGADQTRHTVASGLPRLHELAHINGDRGLTQVAELAPHELLLDHFAKSSPPTKF